MKKLLLVACLVGLCGCNMGEKLFGIKDGEQGPPGPAGAGTRKVYTGVTTTEPQSIVIPELTVTQKPAIQVLIKQPGYSLFYEIPGLYNVDITTQNPYWSYNNAASVTIALAAIGTSYMIIVLT